MSRRRIFLRYGLLVSVIAIAAGVISYFAWLTALEQAKLGEQTLADNALLLVREKVESLEQMIIAADNEVFQLVNVNDPETIVSDWRPSAKERTPSVRAVVAIREGQIVADSVRGSARDRRKFLALLRKKILPELALDSLETGHLKHLHYDHKDEAYLFSAQRFHTPEGAIAIVAHHDVGFIVREYLPRLFSSKEAENLYNVLNENGRPVFGPGLSEAGDFVVGLRFPTTLYRWRLQFAPPLAEELDESKRNRRISDVSTIVVSVLIILVAIVFLLFTAFREERLNALKSTFIANVSHELKTPLAAIRMFSELLLSGRVSKEEKRKEYVTIIARETERLTGLIENVLDFAAVERGKAQYDLLEGNLEIVIRDAIETFSVRVDPTPAVTVHVLNTIPPLHFDEQSMVLAVINLLDNAHKYAPGSEIDIEIEQRRDFVQIRVRDRGPGIPSGQHKRIFERFVRFHGSQISGSGIGLSLVKHIAISHGGRAWAENAEGGGALIGFAIPISK